LFAPSADTPIPHLGPFPIAYDGGMLGLVLAMHAGSESMPEHRRWIHEHMGGRVVALRERLLPQIRAFTNLREMDILDFGCGTGSTTAVLAEAAVGSRTTGIDIDARGLEIARRRLRHHGVDQSIELLRVPPVSRAGDLPLRSESFDFILANAVLEHVVPVAARPQVVLEMWRLLRPGGLLYISETPNPLCPARGRRGMTYWGVVRPLRKSGARFEVLNLTAGRNRLLPAGAATTPSSKRRAATFALETLVGKPLAALGVPVIALGPVLEHLCLRKLPAAVKS
jgi:2-polyprenyl-3-methyl-5-hydroxy-6-metoxy-1,4-benzoquinol methylase